MKEKILIDNTTELINCLVEKKVKVLHISKYDNSDSGEIYGCKIYDPEQDLRRNVVVISFVEKELIEPGEAKQRTEDKIIVRYYKGVDIKTLEEVNFSDMNIIPYARKIDPLACIEELKKINSKGNDCINAAIECIEERNSKKYNKKIKHKRI